MRIEVYGSGTTKHAAERATLGLTVSKDGTGNREDFVRPVAELRQELLEHVKTLQVFSADGKIDPASPVLNLHAGSINTHSYREWTDKGRSNRLTHNVRMDMRIEWQDKDKLQDFCATVAMNDLVTLGSIAWKLSPETEQRLKRGCRKAAVADAFSKATDYVEGMSLATSKQFSPIKFDKIDDGSIDSGTMLQASMAPPPGGALLARGFGGAARSAPEIQFSPEDLEVRSNVRCEFEVEQL